MASLIVWDWHAFISVLIIQFMKFLAMFFDLSHVVVAVRVVRKSNVFIITALALVAFSDFLIVIACKMAQANDGGRM